MLSSAKKKNKKTKQNQTKQQLLTISRYNDHFGCFRTCMEDVEEILY